ncbi:MAG: PEP-CTERM sorting domain-containing protein [Verrucomicrobia bacterium]|nr:PEP-CTERM sorting domain-containing protein [Verrucomicrobiota bacterium]
MKRNVIKTLGAALSIIALIATTNRAAAQAFNADSRGETFNGSGATGIRLFQSGALISNTNTPSPIGSAVWFVVDTATNGVPTNFLGGLPGFGPGGVLGSDDQLIWLDQVDGSAPGTTAGRFVRAGIHSSLLDATTLPSAHYYLYIWNFLQNPIVGSGTNDAAALSTATAPVIGSQFGLVDFGVLAAPPALASLSLNFSANVWADTYTVTAVPEPSAIALAGVGALGLIALRRRKK